MAPAEPHESLRPPGERLRQGTPASFDERGALKALRQMLAPRYLLEAEVARGGMARVYGAVDRKHGRRVAIKVLHPGQTGALGAERFLREIELVAGLTHPHIVPLIDSGAAGDLLYYVMPLFVEGSLAGLIERERRLSAADTLRITDEMADALGHAHAHGLVHRDVKPSNVMMAAGHAVVSDFGLARAIELATGDRLTPTDVNVGTPLYMSPEQFHRSPELDGRSDQYSLACVVFEMLAGQPPFSGRIEIVAFQHCSVEPPPLSSLRPDVPFSVTHALQRALAKLPGDRFSTVAEFARALRSEPPAADVNAPETVRAATPHNLPRLATSFVGRENEIWECARVMEAHRLVTLTGVGGSGKTRLAVRLAERRLEAHPGGVWFVELASVTDPARVIQAVAGSLGVRERPDRGLPQMVQERIGSARVLLLLDNCEHVREGCAEVARGLLEACPELTVLATSREPLGLPGERAFRVPPMGVPPATPPSAVSAIANFESVRLFVARAAAAAAGFRLTEANAHAVAEVCRRLEGIPLAIELAAARARMLSMEEIRQKLDDRFRLASSASAAAVSRHQTLRAAIDWSYELLDAEEQRTLRALAVFRGGWTLAAATSVCSAGDSFATLDAMTRLAEKSLLLLDTSDAGESRYRMLETVRLYALERLEAEGESESLQDAHLAYCLALADSGDRAIWSGREQAAWLDRLTRDHENLLAALAWADAGERRNAEGLKLAASLYRFWYTRGHYETARAALDRALTAPGAQASDGLRGQALFAAAGIAVFEGRYAEARDLYGRSLAIWRSLDDPRGVARTLVGLALVDAAEGRYADARASNHESLSVYRQLGDTHSVQIVLHNLGDVALCEGAWSEARSLFEGSMATANEDRTLTALTHGRLALVAIRQGDLGGAVAPLKEALQAAIDLRAVDSGLEAVDAAAELAAVSGHHERAARMFGCSDALRDSAATPKEAGFREQVRGVIERLRAAIGAEAFARAWALDREIPLETACASALEWLEETGPEWLDTDG